MVWFRFLLPGILLICISDSALGISPHLQGTDWARLLPERPGKAYVVTLCSRCHTLEKIVLQRRSESEWLAIIGKMTGQENALLSEHEISEIVSYLGTHFNLDPPVASHAESDGMMSTNSRIDWAMLLPEEEGRERVVVYCSSCHGLKIVVQSRKGWDAWYNNITWMVDTFDAPVPDREITLLAGYLSAHLGEDNPFGQIPFDLNTTSLEALEKLPFLTSDHIEKLERYRSRQPFTSIQEFTRILELSGDLSRLSRIYLRVDSP